MSARLVEGRAGPLESNMSVHDERKLPKWAQELISEPRDDLVQERALRRRTTEAHAVLLNREWFTIPGPDIIDSVDFRRLWWLERDNPYAACSLGRGDVLLVGRAVLPIKAEG